MTKSRIKLNSTSKTGTKKGFTNRKSSLLQKVTVKNTTRTSKLKSATKTCVSKTIACLHKGTKTVPFLLAGVFIVFSLYHLAYAKRIIPGVYIGTTKLSGLTQQQAKAELEKTILTNTKTLSIAVDNKAYEVTPQDLKLEYDIESTINKAVAVGREDSLYINTKKKLAGLIKPIRVVAQYNYNKAFLYSVTSQIKIDSDVLAKDAEFIISTDNIGLSIVPETLGKSVSEQEIHDKIKNSLDALDFSTKTIEVKEDLPQIRQTDLQRIQPELEKVVLKDVTLNANGRKYIIQPQDLIKLLEIQKEANNVVIKLHRDNFNSYQNIIAKQINQLPIGEVTETDGSRVTSFQIIKNGLQIDDKEFSKAFKKALFEGKHELDIPMIEIKSTDNGREYGIFTLLGTGISKFVGSAQPRIQNLTLAAQRTSGILVPPDETYSFNNSIGEISAATGYATAYIISQGRTVLGEGGGVCQTSTTLFRAVLNAGLPVVSRYPHAYRVSYYEQDSPVGLDASVYQPSLDFKFKNDTANYILVQASWDLGTSTLQFDIYGTPDGREVEISEPTVSNVSAPPAPLYQDDPSLPKGTTKQVDFSAWGATVEIKRKVTRNNDVLTEDTFKTVYQPWRAVYLVGTR